MRTDIPDTAYPLRNWLEIFHRPYWPLLGILLGIGVISGALMYLSLEILEGVVRTFVGAAGTEQISAEAVERGHWSTRFIVNGLGIQTSWLVVVMVLAVYALVTIVQAIFQYLNIRFEALLEIRSRNDIEREILLNLLRKDDQFFQTHPVTEITNRLTMDTSQMFERRKDLSDLFNALFQGLGILIYLGLNHWSYAAAALAFSLIAMFVAKSMLGDMRMLHTDRMRSEDGVKSAFEDYLGAVPELQMGALENKTARNLNLLQEIRQRAFMGMTMLNGRMQVLFQTNQLVALLAILGTIVYIVFAHDFELTDGLIAVVIARIPQFYGYVDEVVRTGVQFNLARISFNRLLEYETDPPMKGDPAISAQAVASAPISIENVTYAYTRGGQIRGGADGISLEMKPRSLIVFVGPSGSGKTTLTQLMMGRMRPVSGSIRVGDAELARFGPEQRAELYGYMPQRPMIVDGTLDENLRFGLKEDSGPRAAPFDKDAMSWIDSTMVGEFARDQALNLTPINAQKATELAGDLKGLREKLRKAVDQDAGVSVREFSTAALVPHLTVLENLTASAADTMRLIQDTQAGVHGPTLHRMSEVEPADIILRFARSVVEQTRQLLERCETFERYAELAPFPISPAVWGIRSDLVRMGPIDESDPMTREDLMLVGLTAMPREAGADEVSQLAGALAKAAHSEFGDIASGAFADALERLDPAALNRHLSWRDNLLYGIAEVTNTRGATEVDKVLLGTLADHPLDSAILVSGLCYRVGRQGKRLSGGQHKLVSLCRTLLQGNPVMILDEPTAGLDPNKRQHVHNLLREAATERTIITITHDAELAQIADQVVMMKDGQLWATGTYEELSRSDATFREVIKAEGEAD